MSRIGSKPVDIIAGVNVTIDGQQVTVKGSKGTLQTKLPAGVSVSVNDNKVVLQPQDQSDRARAMWGLGRSLVANMVQGVSEGFTIKLEINGVGYRAALQGKTLVLNLGYSHPVNFPVPEGIKITCPKPTEIEIFGADKQQVGQVAAVIRSYRRPEPYKGKGIKYADEIIRRKEGKKK